MNQDRAPKKCFRGKEKGRKKHLLDEKTILINKNFRVLEQIFFKKLVQNLRKELESFPKLFVRHSSGDIVRIKKKRVKLSCTIKMRALVGRESLRDQIIPAHVLTGENRFSVYPNGICPTIFNCNRFSSTVLLSMAKDRYH